MAAIIDDTYAEAFRSIYYSACSASSTMMFGVIV